MNTLLKGIKELKEVSKSPEDFEYISGTAIADCLAEYWADWGIDKEQRKLLSELYALDKKNRIRESSWKES